LFYLYALGESAYIGRRAPGLHGYRYQLPGPLLTLYRGKTLSVELVVFTDGEAMEVAHIDGRSFVAAAKTPFPPR
jgi:hypothetical protein